MPNMSLTIPKELDKKIDTLKKKEGLTGKPDVVLDILSKYIDEELKDKVKDKVED